MRNHVSYSVGYNNVLLKGNKMNLLCVSWETIGNNNHKATLNEVMDTSKLTSYSEDGETPGVYINAWDMEAGNWGKIYYYVNQPSWNEGEYDWTDTWCDGETMPCNDEIEPGSALWLFHLGTDVEDFTFMGQVANSGVKSYTLAKGKMNLCGNPYPANLDLNNKNQVTIANKTSYSEDGETPGDYINTWDLTTGNWGAIYYYVNQPSWNEGEYDWTDTWCDGETMPVDSTTIPAGSGFWYYACGEGTTFTFTEIK